MQLDRFEIQSLKEAIRSPWLYTAPLLAALWAFVLYGVFSYALAAGLFALILTALTLIDLKHMMLPDILTLTGIPLGLIIAPFFLSIYWVDSLAGAILGYGIFFLIATAFKKVKGKDGMGLGDVKLLSMLGAWCGAFTLPLILLGSSIIGLLFFVLRKTYKGTPTNKPMPYGPFLAISAWIALLYGHALWSVIFQWRSNLTMFILGE